MKKKAKEELHMSKKSKSSSPLQKIFNIVRHIWKGDRPWIGAFILIDIFLFLLAMSYFQSVTELSVSAISRSPAADSTSSLQTLELLAGRGSWESFEKARMEEVAHYLQTNSRPPAGIALYFYPETLPEQSLERYFAFHDLKPKIEALHLANSSKQSSEANLAYQQLESRVINFELGVAADTSDLSDEAKKFLSLYYEFTKLNR